MVSDFKSLCEVQTGEKISEDPGIRASITAVFDSWMNPRAIYYEGRINFLMHGEPQLVQAMVYGNMGSNSGTGVAFAETRNWRKYFQWRIFN
jgi:pyruvate,orthophosphate dikinase